MTFNHLLILEILSIEEVNNQSFLKINFFTNMDQTVLYWLIDDETSKSLLEICDFNGTDRYRLSLQTTYDEKKDCYFSYVTKTFRDTSSRINFQCSSNYHEQLECVKNYNNFESLLSLDFLYAALPKEQTDVNENDHSEIIEVTNEREIKITQQEDTFVDETTEDSEENKNQEKVIEDTTPINEKSIIRENPDIKVDEATSSTQSEKIENEETVSKKKSPIKQRTIKNTKPIQMSSQHLITACLIGAILLISLIIIFDTYSQSKGNNETVSNSYMESKDIESGTLSTNKVGSTSEKQDFNVPTLQLDDILTFHVPEGFVALTFNDGPSKYTNSIVDILKRYEVGGTFFFIGYNVQKHPTMVEYVHSNGFTIGSLSMTHNAMNKQSMNEQLYEVIESKKIIEETIHEPIKLFRPPYGLFDETTKKVTEQEQFKIVLWNHDFHPKDIQSADELVEKVKNTPSSGSIITLYESQHLVEALPSIIEHLQQQNLTILSLK